MRRWLFGTALVFGTASWVALAQVSDLQQRAFTAMSSGNYLQSLTLIERALTTSKSADERSQVLQELAGARSRVGDIRGALAAFDQYPSSQETVPLGDLGAEPAIESIVRASQGRRVVILNEAHHVPQHRAFGLQLALALRRAGFTHLACETFNPGVSSSKPPDLQTGYYTSEPVFADFVRQSVKVGFKLIAYESQSNDNTGDFVDQINRRETEQAQNLIDRVIAKDPKARVFVYVGWSHASEKWEKAEDGKRDLAWMAARLARATGLDPLTIDQTDFTERGKPSAESVTYRALLEKFGPVEPLVLRSESNGYTSFGGFQGQVDMQVLHPRSVYEFDRPNWLRLGGLRGAVPIPAEFLAFKERVLVQAFRAEEPSNAVPLDQVLVSPNRTSPRLMLEPGAYRLQVQDLAGKTRASVKFYFERQ
jgi:tetratricopeptide (TPR) repeat protein